MTSRKPGRPPGATEKEARLEIRAEQDWMDRITKQADRWGLSVAAYIRTAATEKLERDEASHKEP